MTDNGSQRTLQQLVLDLKAGRSYDRLSRDCGGIPTAARLAQIGNSRSEKRFPAPETVKGLAAGLGVSVTEVVLASAASLGLPVRSGSAPGEMVLADVGDLPSPARDAVLAVAREMVRLHRVAVGSFGSGKSAAASMTGSVVEAELEDRVDAELLDQAAGHLPEKYRENLRQAKAKQAPDQADT